MDINKGLKFIAIGFIITLLNINLTINGVTVNVTPNFIGWILLYLAHDKLGKYTENKSYLKWLALALIILTGANWILAIAMPNNNLKYMTTIINIANLVYIYGLLGIIENIANDYNSSMISDFKAIKYILLVAEILVTIFALFVTQNNLTNALAVIILVLLLIEFITTIVLAFKLLKFSNEISNKTNN